MKQSCDDYLWSMRGLIEYGLSGGLPLDYSVVFAELLKNDTRHAVESLTQPKED